MYQVSVIYQSKKSILQAADGENLLDLLTRNGFSIDAPCGGTGTCGKCMVSLNGKIVKSCHTKINGDCSVLLPEKGNMRVTVKAFCVDFLPDGDTPILGKSGDAEAVAEASGETMSVLGKTGDAEAVAEASGETMSVLGKTGDAEAAAETSGETMSVLGKTGDELPHAGTKLGIGIDIGTTTVAAYLVELSTGRVLKTASGKNTQSSFGADVISRIKYSMEHGIEPLQEAIVKQLNDLIRQLKTIAGVSDSYSIRKIAIAANTVMLHYLAGLDPAGIAFAPFTPASLFGYYVNAAALGLDADCDVYLMPCVAGYVGGDITSGLLSSGAWQNDALSLFLDLGTNGEIALGNKQGFLTCAAAAGPAFEGANIECGSPAIPGAIRKVFLKDGFLNLETIGALPPSSICGSGLVDLIAVLLDLGFIDETGRLLPPDELEDILPEDQSQDSMHDPSLNRPVDFPAGEQTGNSSGDSGQNPRSVVSENFPAGEQTGNQLHSLKWTQLPERSGSFIIPVSALLTLETDEGVRFPLFGDSLWLSAKDVRQVQLAKAAIAAGIEVLLKNRGCSASSLDKVYLAGGFGNYISPASAVRIGLLPEDCLPKIFVTGNSAGAGTIAHLFSSQARNELENLRGLCTYTELSTCPEFTDAYMDAMMFET